MAALRAAGLPLANTADTSEDESSQSQIVCIAVVKEDVIHALVATPSGLVYRFEPKIFELSFWSFAARYYYWVTFSLADREQVSQLTGVSAKAMKGKAMVRGKSERNIGSLDALLNELTGTSLAAQSGLF